MASKVHLSSTFGELNSSLGEIIDEQVVVVAGAAPLKNTVSNALSEILSNSFVSGIDAALVGVGNVSNTVLNYLSGLASSVPGQLGTSDNFMAAQPKIRHLASSPGTNLGLWRNTNSEIISTTSIDLDAINTGSVSVIEWNYLRNLSKNSDGTGKILSEVGIENKSAGEYPTGLLATDSATLARQFNVLKKDIESLISSHPLKNPPIDSIVFADGSVSNTEFQHLDGVTINIQDSINTHFNRLGSIGNVTGDVIQIDPSNIGSGLINETEFLAIRNLTSDAQDQLTAIKAKIDSIGNSAAIAPGTISNNEFNTLNGLDSNLQNQIDIQLARYNSFTEDTGNLTISRIGGYGSGLTHMDNLTGNIQTQLDNAYDQIDSVATITGNTVIIDASKISENGISNTEFGYLSGLSSNLQDQINSAVESINKLARPGTTFSGRVGSEIIAGGLVSNTEFGYLAGLTPEYALGNTIDHGGLVTAVELDSNVDIRFTQKYSVIDASNGTTAKPWAQVYANVDIYMSEDIWPLTMSDDLNTNRHYSDIASDGTTMLTAHNVLDINPASIRINGTVETIDAETDPVNKNTNLPYPLQYSTRFLQHTTGYRYKGSSSNPSENTFNLTGISPALINSDTLDTHALANSSAIATLSGTMMNSFVTSGNYTIPVALQYFNKSAITKPIEISLTTGEFTEDPTGFLSQYGKGASLNSSYSSVSLTGQSSGITIEIKGYSGSPSVRDVIKARRDFINTAICYDSTNSRWLAAGIIRWYDTGSRKIEMYQALAIVEMGSSDPFDNITAGFRSSGNIDDAKTLSISGTSLVVPAINPYGVGPYDYRTIITGMVEKDGHLFYSIGPLHSDYGGGYEFRIADISGGSTNYSEVVVLKNIVDGTNINTHESRFDGVPISLTKSQDSIIGIDRHSRIHYIFQESTGNWLQFIDPVATKGFRQLPENSSIFTGNSNTENWTNSPIGIEYVNGKLYILRRGEKLETAGSIGTGIKVTYTAGGSSRNEYIGKLH